MDKYFKEIKPLLTNERENKIRQYFINLNTEKISFADAYKIILDLENNMLNYDYNYFLEDLECFELESAGEMSVNEVIHFLNDNQ